MKKNCFVLLLVAAMLLTLLAGCADIDEGPQVNEEPTAEQPKESLSEYYFTLDAYTIAGGTLSVTQAGEEGVESGSWGFMGKEGARLGDVLEAQGITTLDVYLDGDVFEGWMVYEETLSIDEDGLEEYTYELRSGDKLYTTQELMDLTVPSYDAMYVAKWAGIPVENYFTEEDYMVDEDTSGTVLLTAGDGMMRFAPVDGSEEFESKVYSYWLENGQSINDLAGNENWDILISVEKDGAEFTGWTVYEGRAVTWDSEESSDENAMTFSYVVDDPSYEGFEYIHIADCELYREGMSTEELLYLVNPGTNYYAIPNWE